MIYRLLFLLAALGCLLATALLENGLLRIWFGWSGVSLVIVATGYLGLGPRVLGKRGDGRRSWWLTLLLGPYLLVTWTIWYLLRFIVPGPPYHKLRDDLYIGRRAMTRELPRQVQRVVDLTAELDVPRGLIGRVSYLTFPTLDATPPRREVLERLARLLSEEPAITYLHCAQGHGRAGTAAAALLLLWGNARSAADAVAAVKAVRPGVALKPEQMRMLQRLEPR